MAAVALPNLLGQVAKGRQAEAKNNLGAINRAQQAHRLETGNFGVIQLVNVAAAVAPIGTPPTGGSPARYLWVLLVVTILTPI
nr:type IV pilin-like G/H family protein [Pleurocapsa sp. FMAR1]